VSITSNIVFFGTPPLAVASLKAIQESGRRISLVITQPDRPVGRGQKMTSPAVKRFCQEHGLSVLQPKKMKDAEFLRQLQDTGSKIFVVAAYGRILPKAILDIPEMTLNVHGSLLPRWRGAAPIARAILAGERQTGITIMRLVEEMDAGDYCHQHTIEILPNETTEELTIRLSKVGGEAIVEALNQVDRGTAKFKAQDISKVTFAPPIQSEEGIIQWNRLAQEIHNQVRALNPWPGTFVSDGQQRIKIHKTQMTENPSAASVPGTLRFEKHRLFVSTADIWLEVLELQREGKVRQAAASFIPGYLHSKVSRWG
jgi:methionyl-tRNA formyltransferase